MNQLAGYLQPGSQQVELDLKRNPEKGDHHGEEKRKVEEEQGDE